MAILVPAAQAADITVLVPPVVASAGIRDIGVAYTKQSGQNVKLEMSAMAGILERAETATPAADLVALPSDMMDQYEHDHGILPGSRKRLGRMEIDLAVPVGAPHPDISTPEKLIAVLKAAKGVAYDDPAGRTMMAWIIQSMLARPELQGVHSVIGHGQALAEMDSGEADMALMLADEINRDPKASDAGPLPPYFGAHIDLDIAISARSADPKAAAAVIDYFLSSAADPIWASKHLSRR